MFGDDRSDGVYSLVPTQTLRVEAGHGANDGFEVFGNLVLDNGMKGRVSQQVGQINASLAMMFFREPDAFLFVERQPLRWVWREVRIVAIQRVVSLWWPRSLWMFCPTFGDTG